LLADRSSFNYRNVFLFVLMGVRGKPRMYYSLLAYCTARFGRSNFGGSWNLWAGEEGPVNFA
jgi:hypothetical protein